MSPSLAELRREAAGCRRCSLWKLGTQTVFSEGRTRGLMLVGEQPGDAEDRAGRPFVGPAGRKLRELLEEVGIPDESVYFTNAVKHFKWRPAGKRRLHDKPNWSEIQACSYWLTLELAVVRLKLVVCLGATAAQALLGKTARVGQLRGQVLQLANGVPALVTMHPSAVLRAGDQRKERRAELVADLELARETLAELTTGRGARPFSLTSASRLKRSALPGPPAREPKNGVRLKPDPPSSRRQAEA